MAAVQHCLLAILATAAYAQSEALMGVALVETNPHKNLRSGTQPKHVQEAMAHYKCMIKMKQQLKLPADAKPIKEEESKKMLAELQGNWKIALMEKPEHPICPELKNLKTIQYKKANVTGNIAVLSGGIDSDGKTKRMQTQVLMFTRSKDKTLYIDQFGTKVIKFETEKGNIAFRNALGYTIHWERDQKKSVEADASKANKKDEKKSAKKEKESVKKEQKADKKANTEKTSAEKKEKSATTEKTADAKAIAAKKSDKKENKVAKEDKAMQKAIHKIEEKVEDKSAKKKSAKGEPKVKITEVKITDVQTVEDTKLLVQKESMTVGSGLAPMGVGMMA